MFNEIKACKKCKAVPDVSILGGTRFSFASLTCKCQNIIGERTKSHLNLEEKVAMVNNLIECWNLK